MKSAKILCVCGSGTVSSAMVGLKIKEALSEKGYEVKTVEVSPNSLDSALVGDQFDLIACVSPVYKEYDIPKVNAVGLLTGLDEEKVISEFLEILEKK